MATYTVKNGDTLSAIAKANGTTVSAIMAANPNIKNANKIYTGNQITIPGSTTTKTTTTTTSKPATTSTSASTATNTAYKTNLSGLSSGTSANLAKYSGNYSPTATVNAAQTAKTNSQNAVTNYGQYNSAYRSDLDSLYNQIITRDKFSYDANSDPLYNAYKDQYTQLGQLAMKDTVGQAAALTGGYSNSYAVTAGSQAYQQYMNQLAGKIPELYQLALDSYSRQTEDLYNRYNLVKGADDSDYAKWSDQYQRLIADRDYYSNEYDNAYNRDYAQWADNRSFWQAMAESENSNYWTQTNYNYQKQRDAVADSQWNKQYALQQQELALKAAAAKSSSSSSSKKKSSSSGSSSAASTSTSSSSSSKKNAYTGITNDMIAAVNGKTDSTAAAKQAKTYLDAGKITEKEYTLLVNGYKQTSVNNLNKSLPLITSTLR